MYRNPIARWSISLVFSFLAVVAAGSDASAQTVLSFEDPNLPNGSTMGTQYSNRGVLFDAGYVDVDPGAHSGNHVVRAIPPGVEFYAVIPYVIRFRPEMTVTRVKLFAGSQTGSLNGKLTAFDSESGGNIVAVAGHLVPQNTFTTAFEVSAAKIGRVEFQLDGTSYSSIDDFEFDSGAAPPLPTTAPVVQLTLPINNIDVDIPGDLPRLDIAGTVTGDGLLPRVTVTVAYRYPPEQSSAGPLKLVLDLTGTGTTRQFALAGGMTPLALGPVTVTAVAENIAALKGSATSSLTNLPLGIRNRFGELGGTSALGQFQYGVRKPCAIAVYERGAISGGSVGSFFIGGEIFTKWLSLRGGFNESGWFGCPNTEEGDTLGARSQSFERGRIYTNLPGTNPPRAVYVPAIFTEAIDKRGGDPGIGLPLSDPTDSAGARQTWLFQQFDRPEDEKWLLPSTLEIRGTPAKLWMERQVGEWLQGPGLYSDTFKPSTWEAERQKSGATLWESFSCSEDRKTCPVTAQPEFPPPITDENKPDFRNKFCSGGTYIPASPWGPPEWKAVRGNYDATPVFGAVLTSHMVDIDNALTHHTHNAHCPYIGWALAIGSPLVGTAHELGAPVDPDEYAFTCASDFEVSVRPLGQQVETLPQLPSLFGEENTDRIRTEYEAAYAAEAHNFLGPPIPGDLIHMTGRWIVDCGHKTYRTELHPLFSYARAKTVISETNSFTQMEYDLFGGRPATRIAIWVNGWYPGGDNNAIEFDIFPPPRPSADAVLHVVKPVDSGSGGYRAAIDVNLEPSILPLGSPTYVHLKFTAPRRENFVSNDGEMFFRTGRQYWGIWYLYWGK